MPEATTAICLALAACISQGNCSHKATYFDYTIPDILRGEKTLSDIPLRGNTIDVVMQFFANLQQGEVDYMRCELSKTQGRR